MKSLQFNFGHPVKGHACLLQLLATKPDSLNFKVDSKESNLLEVPIANCKKGKWKLTLDWEHDSHSYSHQEEFEVKG
jgi:hypothetical protein